MKRSILLLYELGRGVGVRDVAKERENVSVDKQILDSMFHVATLLLKGLLILPSLSR